MKRRLIIMRHAKSGWNGLCPDHQRTLVQRGRRDAALVGQALFDAGWWPDHAVVSDARRTQETWECLTGTQSATVAPRHQLNASLYCAGMGALRPALDALPDAVGTALALGHNPGWQMVVLWLSGESIEMKTGTAVLLEGEGTSWREALSERESFKLVRYFYPKQLR